MDASPSETTSHDPVRRSNSRRETVTIVSARRSEPCASRHVATGPASSHLCPRVPGHSAVLVLVSRLLRVTCVHALYPRSQCSGIRPPGHVFFCAAGAPGHAGVVWPARHIPFRITQATTALRPCLTLSGMFFLPSDYLRARRVPSSDWHPDRAGRATIVVRFPLPCTTTSTVHPASVKVRRADGDHSPLVVDSSGPPEPDRRASPGCTRSAPLGAGHDRSRGSRGRDGRTEVALPVPGPDATVHR